MHLLDTPSIIITSITQEMGEVDLATFGEIALVQSIKIATIHKRIKFIQEELSEMEARLSRGK